MPRGLVSRRKSFVRAGNLREADIVEAPLQTAAGCSQLRDPPVPTPASRDNRHGKDRK
ncbi:hypothetical protein E4U16_000269, partial [Claviceps sp. LM84 group G4]